MISGHLTAHNPPESLAEIQVWTVGGERHRSQSLLMLPQERPQHRGGVTRCAIPHYKAVVVGIHRHQVGQMLSDFLVPFVIIHLVESFPCRILHASQQVAYLIGTRGVDLHLSARQLVDPSDIRTPVEARVIEEEHACMAGRHPNHVG